MTNNKQYQRDWMRKWRRDNPEKVKIANQHPNSVRARRKIQIRKRFGLEIEQYESLYNILFSQQKGKCAICKKHQDELNKPLFLDHNHLTNEFRGLLCHKCNLAIGLLNTDNQGTELLSESIKYLLTQRIN